MGNCGAKGGAAQDHADIDQATPRRRATGGEAASTRTRHRRARSISYGVVRKDTVVTSKGVPVVDRRRHHRGLTVGGCSTRLSEVATATTETEVTCREEYKSPMRRPSSLTKTRWMAESPPPLLPSLERLRQRQYPSQLFQQVWRTLEEAAYVFGPSIAAPSSSLGEWWLLPPLGNVASPVRTEIAALTEQPSTEGRGGKGGGRGGADPRLDTAPPTSSLTLLSKKGGGGMRSLNCDTVFIEGDADPAHHILCQDSAFHDKQIWVRHLRRRSCFVLELSASANVEACEDSLLVFAPVAGTLSLSHCHRCLVVAAADQVTLFSCSSVLLSLSVKGLPVIEACSDIGVAPLLSWYAYNDLPRQLRCAQLSPFCNNFSTVRDRTPPPPPLPVSTPSDRPLSPTSMWTLMPVVQRNFFYVELWMLEGAVWEALVAQRWAQIVGEMEGASARKTFTEQLRCLGGSAAWEEASSLQAKGLTDASNPDVETASVAIDDHERSESAPSVAATASMLRSTVRPTRHVHGAGDVVVTDKHGGAEADQCSGEFEFHSVRSLGTFGSSISAIALTATLCSPHDTCTTPLLSGNPTGSSIPATTSAPPPLCALPTSISSPMVERGDPHGMRIPHPGKDGDAVLPDAPPPLNLPRWREPRFGDGSVDAPPIAGLGSSGMPSKLRDGDGTAERVVCLVLGVVPLVPLSVLPNAASLLAVYHEDAGKAKGEGHREGGKCIADACGGHQGASQAVPNVAAAAPSPANLTTPLCRSASTRYSNSGAFEDTAGGQQGFPCPLSSVNGVSGTAVRASSDAPSLDDVDSAIKLQVAFFTHTCAVPATMGARLIPVDFFKQQWGLKLVVLSGTSGGWKLATRIARDIEGGRRQSFLEALPSLMRNAPLPSPRRSGDQVRCNDTEEGEAKQNASFRISMVDYLRHTTLTQRCGPVLLLNTVELSCTEAAVRDHVAPVFYHLCGAAGLANGGDSDEPSKGCTCPESPTPSTQAVVMRRLFGEAIQRMRQQTCLLMLALTAPSKIPGSAPPAPVAGERRSSSSTNGGESTWTTSDLHAWAQRADRAQRIFTPQVNPGEDGEAAMDEAEAPQSPTRRSRLDAPPTPPPPMVGEMQSWKDNVLLNVTVPLYFVSFLQRTLFFRTQLTPSASDADHSGHR